MEEVLRKKKSALTALYTTDSTAFKYYQESIKMRISGRWRDAGDKLVKCGDLYLFIRLILEAATIYSEAAECYLKVDKSEALRAYALSIKTYCELGKFSIAGQLERKIAMIHYRIHHYDDAAIHFRKAANFLSGDKNIAQTDLCLEMTAECLIKSGECAEPHIIFENLAISCSMSNLRRFEARNYLLMAILCLCGVVLPTTKLVPRPPVEGEEEPLPPLVTPLSIAELITQYTAKYDEVKAKIQEYDKLDFLWKVSRHKKLLTNLLKFRLELDIHNFTDHIYYWNNITPWNEVSLVLVQNMLLELQMEAEKVNKPVSGVKIESIKKAKQAGDQDFDMIGMKKKAGS